MSVVAVETFPFDDARAAIVESRPGIDLDIDKESRRTCIPCAAAVAVRIRAHVIDDRVDFRSVLSEAESF